MMETSHSKRKELRGSRQASENTNNDYVKRIDELTVCNKALSQSLDASSKTIEHYEQIIVNLKKRAQIYHRKELKAKIQEFGTCVKKLFDLHVDILTLLPKDIDSDDDDDDDVSTECINSTQSLSFLPSISEVLVSDETAKESHRQKEKTAVDDLQPSTKRKSTVIDDQPLSTMRKSPVIDVQPLSTRRKSPVIDDQLPSTSQNHVQKNSVVIDDQQPSTSQGYLRKNGFIIDDQQPSTSKAYLRRKKQLESKKRKFSSEVRQAKQHKKVKKLRVKLPMPKNKKASVRNTVMNNDSLDGNKGEADDIPVQPNQNSVIQEDTDANTLINELPLKPRKVLNNRSQINSRVIGERHSSRHQPDYPELVVISDSEEPPSLNGLLLPRRKPSGSLSNRRISSEELQLKPVKVVLHDILKDKDSCKWLSPCTPHPEDESLDAPKENGEVVYLGETSPYEPLENGFEPIITMEQEPDVDIISVEETDAVLEEEYHNETLYDEDQYVLQSGVPTTGDYPTDAFYRILEQVTNLPHCAETIL